MDKYDLRELHLIPVKNKEYKDEVEVTDITFESVDKIVTTQLSQVESDFYDPKILMEMYRNL